VIIKIKYKILSNIIIEDLQQQSSNFKRGANRVRKQMWWKDMKLKIILGVIVGLIILFIFSMYSIYIYI